MAFDEFSVRNFSTKIPELNEFRNLTGTGQELVFYSVLQGIKKSMDLWVPVGKFEAFRKFCDKNGIFCLWDVKFVKPEDRATFEKSVGGEYLTTTKTLAEFPDSESDGTIHCFIARTPERAKSLFQYGWYPAVCEDRVVYKNYQDLIEFWYHLGYPECCIQFFFEKNDWAKYNFPFEIFRKSESFDFRCNPFWKDVGFSYVYNMPCSFSCEKTADMAERTRQKLFQEDSELCANIDRFLKLPLLSIREQKIYAFEGEMESPDSLRYSKVYRLGNKAEGDIAGYLEQWDRLTVRENRFITAYAGDVIVFEYDCEGASKIETPFLLTFS